MEGWRASTRLRGTAKQMTLVGLGITEKGASHKSTSLRRFSAGLCACRADVAALDSTSHGLLPWFLMVCVLNSPGRSTQTLLDRVAGCQAVMSP
jgi:hypothetical protein